MLETFLFLFPNGLNGQPSEPGGWLLDVCWKVVWKRDINISLHYKRYLRIF